jgi:hypothetical protein
MPRIWIPHCQKLGLRSPFFQVIKSEPAMAEEIQNTISLYGPVDAVEEVARLIGASLFENLESQSTDEFILLWNGVAQPDSPQDILDGCVVDSIVFDKDWAKISLTFRTRREPFPVRILTSIMNEFPQVFMEIQTLGDCSGLTGILAKAGQNLAIRKLGLGEGSDALPNLFAEYFSHRTCIAYASEVMES